MISGRRPPGLIPTVWRPPWSVPAILLTYNGCVADRILCSCVTCPSCGAWVVIQGRISGQANCRDVLSTTCPVQECRKEFLFEEAESRLFDLPLLLFERRHFYRSDLV